MPTDGNIAYVTRYLFVYRVYINSEYAPFGTSYPVEDCCIVKIEDDNWDEDEGERQTRAMSKVIKHINKKYNNIAYIEKLCYVKEIGPNGVEII